MVREQGAQDIVVRIEPSSATFRPIFVLLPCLGLTHRQPRGGLAIAVVLLGKPIYQDIPLGTSFPLNCQAIHL